MEDILSETKKFLIIIRGLSGSGRRTLAQQLCNHQENRIFVSAYDYFLKEDGEFEFNPEDLKISHLWCQTQASTYLAQGYEIVVVYNTFTRAWELEPYFEMATKFQYSTSIIPLFDSGLNDYQLSVRSAEGGVHIPISSIRSQRKRWVHNVLREQRSPRMKFNPNRL